eukprot:NODE_42_length_2078_cov_349.412096_g41_i0.p2 GENE.NODE_42_length_2078_cov_349.412096_g41_i0~~NODE_42_length_2078_cov_349.412096_g41_i0.p2  ORF type:complete len:86 (-),score=4.99 NODE_42_length_2078_cov_349.412096_g41_i0:1547-1804(-)
MIDPVPASLVFAEDRHCAFGYSIPPAKWVLSHVGCAINHSCKLSVMYCTRSSDTHGWFCALRDIASIVHLHCAVCDSLRQKDGRN